MSFAKPDARTVDIDDSYFILTCSQVIYVYTGHLGHLKTTGVEPECFRKNFAKVRSHNMDNNNTHLQKIMCGTTITTSTTTTLNE